MKCCARRILAAFVPLLLSCCAAAAVAQTDITLYRSFAGKVNFVGTGASLRTDSNNGDACAVTDRASAWLSDLPGGAKVEAAYLYWAGSWSTRWGSTRTTPDWDITFDGVALTAERRFTETFPYGWTDYDFFSGFCDVTAIVGAKGNGLYEVADLEVNSGSPHCNVQTVVSGWSLVVVYSQGAETMRVVNVYDGFRYYQGAEIVVTADNFRIADSDIDGKACHITWEGDEGNSYGSGGYEESLTFNGHDLTDAYNPPANQFNSTINVLGSSTSYGVDFDIYDVTPWLNPGDSSATSAYQSGQDLVLLSAEVISVTNAPAVDLSISKTHYTSFGIGEDADFVITVGNGGPEVENSTITVVDDLPAGVDFVSASGTGWTVDASAAPRIVFTRGGALPVGQTAPPITLTVRADGSATGTLTNTASVSSGTFDYFPANNTVTDEFDVGAPSSGLGVVKSVVTVADPFNGAVNPKAIPGATAEYEVEISNWLTERVDRNTVVFVDALPAGTSFFAGDIDGAASGPVEFSDGAYSSRLRYRFLGLGDTTDDVQFSSDGGATFDYTPVPDADGYDPAVTHLRVTPRGRFRARSGENVPSFVLRFLVRLD